MTKQETTRSSHDLHGSAPENSSVALLVIDLFSDFSKMSKAKPEKILTVVTRVRKLIAQARQTSVPVIFVNDNAGRWQSNFEKTMEQTASTALGRRIVTSVSPGEADYFVLKPKHSGFFSTTLETLLKYLQVNTLILTGITTHQCILFTANDAFMRDFRIVVPRDCVYAPNEVDHRNALHHFKTALKADLTPSSRISLGQLKRKKALVST